MKTEIFFTIFYIAINTTLAQKIGNGQFNYTCSHNGSVLNAFNDTNNACGLSPWQISHGSPDLITLSGEAPGQFGLRVLGGANFGPTDSWGSEGVFQNYNFYKGNRYYLRAYVNAYHNGDAGLNGVDKVFIALTNGLEGKVTPYGQNADFNLPGNNRQDIWYKDDAKMPWTLIEQEFIANDNYSQLWISLIDKDGDYASQEFAFFQVAGVYVSCCPYDKTLIGDKSIWSSTLTVGNKIETSGDVWIAGGLQNVIFQAEKGVTLKAGFSASNGSFFTAKTSNFCDCSPGGGNVSDICNVFPGSIIYGGNNPGIYVPNFFNRDVETNWVATSVGYLKPYNAYYWKLKIFNRWGQSVYEAENTSGIDGFDQQSIKWNGGNVSTGTYYIQLDLTNCTDTYTYKSWLQVLGSPHPDSFLVIQEPENNPAARTTSDTEKKEIKVDTTFLYDVSPNPADGLVTFKYSIVEAGPVSLTLYNENSTFRKGIVIEENHPSGLFQFNYSIENLLPGVYYYSLVVKNNKQTKRLVVVR